MPRRYGADGTRLWNGKTPEEFTEADAYRFMAETEGVLQRKELMDDPAQPAPASGKEEFYLSKKDDVLLTPEQIAAEERRWLFDAPIAELPRPYSSACALTMRQVSCVWGSCNTTRWAGCSASGRTLGGRDTRQHLSWRFYSSVFSFRCFCREQVRFAGDKARCAFRYGIRCGNRCGSSGPDRALGFLRFFSFKEPLLTVSFFISGSPCF